MSARVEYGLNREAIAYYDVIVWWWTAFEIEDQSFKPEYIPEIMLEDMRQDQRRNIIQSLPESDPGRKYLILKFFPNGL